jgi:hypothetical protein
VVEAGGQLCPGSAVSGGGGVIKVGHVAHVSHGALQHGHVGAVISAPSGGSTGGDMDENDFLNDLLGSLGVAGERRAQEVPQSCTQWPQSASAPCDSPWKDDFVPVWDTDVSKTQQQQQQQQQPPPPPPAVKVARPGSRAKRPQCDPELLLCPITQVRPSSSGTPPAAGTPNLAATAPHATAPRRHPCIS